MFQMSYFNGMLPIPMPSHTCGNAFAICRPTS